MSHSQEATVTPFLTNDARYALQDALAVAMENTAAARIPECGDFGSIAQNLSWFVSTELPAMAAKAEHQHVLLQAALAEIAQLQEQLAPGKANAEHLRIVAELATGPRGTPSPVMGKNGVRQVLPEERETGLMVATSDFLSLMANAIDNLGDMPISETWAADWVKKAEAAFDVAQLLTVRTLPKLMPCPELPSDGAESEKTGHTCRALLMAKNACDASDVAGGIFFPVRSKAQLASMLLYGCNVAVGETAEPKWVESETNNYAWKNPLIGVGTRLEIADGAINRLSKIIEAQERRIADFDNLTMSLRAKLSAAESDRVSAQSWQ